MKVESGGESFHKMAKLIFVTGGARSGKSRFAVNLAKQLASKVTFVATAIPKDEECGSASDGIKRIVLAIGDWWRKKRTSLSFSPSLMLPASWW